MLDRIAANNITPPPLFTSDEMLSYLSENGIINMNDVFCAHEDKEGSDYGNS